MFIGMLVKYEEVVEKISCVLSFNDIILVDIGETGPKCDSFKVRHLKASFRIDWKLLFEFPFF